MVSTISGKRRSHAAANDVALYNASLKILASRGLDLLTFSDLAKEAGLSRAPIYSRYDSPEDVAIELWESAFEPALKNLFAATSRWHQGSDPANFAEIAQLLTEPSPELRGLVEILGVARRFPSLQDIVRRSLESELDRYIEGESVPASIVISQFNVSLGAVFLAPFLSPSGTNGWGEILPLLHSIFKDQSAWNVPAIQGEVFEFPIAGDPTGDELLDVFLPAIKSVIARAGYEHATANRISREAKRTFNLLYERFPTKELFMEEVVRRWVDNGVRVGFSPFIGVSVDEYLVRSVSSAQSVVAESNRSFRNLRNEMVLAARHHETIGAYAALRFRRSIDFGREMFEQVYENVSDSTMNEAVNFAALVRANSFGLSLVSSITPKLIDVDWTPAVVSLQRCLWKRMLGELKLRQSRV